MHCKRMTQMGGGVCLSAVVITLVTACMTGAICGIHSTGWPPMTQLSWPQLAQYKIHLGFSAHTELWTWRHHCLLVCLLSIQHMLGDLILSYEHHNSGWDGFLWPIGKKMWLMFPPAEIYCVSNSSASCFIWIPTRCFRPPKRHCFATFLSPLVTRWFPHWPKRHSSINQLDFPR